MALGGVAEEARGVGWGENKAAGGGWEGSGGGGGGEGRAKGSGRQCSDDVGNRCT